MASLKNIFKYNTLALAIMFLLGSCKKTEVFPIIPSVEFERFYFTTDQDLNTDTLLGVVFSYRDGDGDIGLNPQDTFPPFNSILGQNDVELNPYFYNLHIDYLTLQDGEFKPVIIPNRTDTLTYYARLQNLTPEGRHKAIRGEIDWKILPPQYEGISRVVKLRIYIYDRALHKSNIIESPVIELP